MIYLIKEKKNTHKRISVIRLRLSCVNACHAYTGMANLKKPSVTKTDNGNTTNYLSLKNI